MTARLGLVTGATGYVGGELVPRLLEQGWRVRVITRDRDKLDAVPWADRVVTGTAGAGEVEVVEGDAGSADDLAEALAGVDVAWYLLHSMGEGDSFVDTELAMARAFADAARDARVGRLVYLGGLHPDHEELSPHLGSRVEVGEILLGSGVPTAALQAGVVVGTDSISFRMLRHLSERLPGALAPRWIRNRIQPIAVTDLLHYLVAAADLDPEVNRTFDIGGPEVLSYADMMVRYAGALGLGRRIVVTAPVTTPRAAARWIGLVTPVRSAMARPLIGSLLHDTVMSEHDLAELVGPPPGGPTGFDDAVRAAAEPVDTGRWRRTLRACAGAVALTAIVGSVATNPRSRWYRSLRKPAFQPPAAVFPIAWTLLYADIAAISALVLADLAEEGRDAERTAYARALAVNLILNAGWSVLFFRVHRLDLATPEAVLLALSSADLVRRAGRVAPEKGVVLAPYALWTAFAAVLTDALRRLNR